MAEDDEYTIGTGYFRSDKQGKNFLGIAVLLFAAIVYWVYREQTFSYNMGMMYATFVIVGYLLVLSGEWFLSKYSLKMVFSPYYSTFDGIIQPIPGSRYVCVRIGGKNVPHWPVELGKEGTIVYPKASNRMGGRCVIPACSFKPIAVDELPANIRNYLLQHNLPKPYLVGYASDEFYEEFPEFETFVQEKEQAHSLANFYEGQTRLRPQATENVARFGSRINKISQGSTFGKVIGRVRNKEEEG